MRNLIEYPVTDEEIIDMLEYLLDSTVSDYCPGNLGPTCLELAIKRVRGNPQTPAENNKEIDL